MTEQPEALRLADWCDAHSSGIYRPSAEAAAELRRLNSEVEMLKRIIENCKAVSDATAEGWRLDQEKFDAVKVARDTMGELWAKEKAHNAELVEALQSTGLFLHHLWCDVQMNDYSFQKLNEQMEIVDGVLKK